MCGSSITIKRLSKVIFEGCDAVYPELSGWLLQPVGASCRTFLWLLPCGLSPHVGARALKRRFPSRDRQP